MAGPLSALRFAHAAIAREAEEIEQAASSVTDTHSAEALARRIDFFSEYMKGHSEAEERSLFPALAARLPYSDAVYLQDHQEEEWLFRELSKLAQAVVQGDRSHALTRLRRQTIALVERTHAHTLRENSVVIPQLEALLTPAQQEEVYDRFWNHLGPQLDATLPWLVQRLSPVLRSEFLDSLQRKVSPERLQVLSSLP